MSEALEPKTITELVHNPNDYYIWNEYYERILFNLYSRLINSTAFKYRQTDNYFFCPECIALVQEGKDVVHVFNMPLIQHFFALDTQQVRLRELKPTAKRFRLPPMIFTRTDPNDVYFDDPSVDMLAQMYVSDINNHTLSIPQPVMLKLLKLYAIADHAAYHYHRYVHTAILARRHKDDVIDSDYRHAFVRKLYSEQQEREQRRQEKMMARKQRAGEGASYSQYSSDVYNTVYWHNIITEKPDADIELYVMNPDAYNVDDDTTTDEEGGDGEDSDVDDSSFWGRDAANDEDKEAPTVDSSHYMSGQTEAIDKRLAHRKHKLQHHSD